MQDATAAKLATEILANAAAKEAAKATKKATVHTVTLGESDKETIKLLAGEFTKPAKSDPTKLKDRTSDEVIEALVKIATDARFYKKPGQRPVQVESLNEETNEIEMVDLIDEATGEVVMEYCEITVDRFEEFFTELDKGAAARERAKKKARLLAEMAKLDD